MNANQDTFFGQAGFVSVGIARDGKGLAKAWCKDSRRRVTKNWDDLLHPRWKGKLGMDDEEYFWYAGMLADAGARLFC